MTFEQACGVHKRVKAIYPRLDIYVTQRPNSEAWGVAFMSGTEEIFAEVD